MSYNIKRAQMVARGGYSGDPGLFDVIGKVVGGVAKVAGGAIGGLLSGGPLGAITGGLKGIGSVIGGGSKTVVPVVTRSSTFPVTPSIVPGRPTSLPGSIPLLPSGGTAFGPMPSDMGGGAAPGTGICKPGYRLVQVMGAGGYAVTKCVKNRRMNPLNPRAASRAMRRLDGFSRATRSVEKMMVKIARKNAPRARSGGSAKGCGCRKR